MISDLITSAKRRGTDEEYREWIRRQKSALSGQWGLWLCDVGEGRCEACHYRTAKNSGVGMKPEYSCIPLTAQEHRRQHQVGQFKFMSRDWWEEQVEKYLIRWINS